MRSMYSKYSVVRSRETQMVHARANVAHRHGSSRAKAGGIRILYSRRRDASPNARVRVYWTELTAAPPCSSLPLPRRLAFSTAREGPDTPGTGQVPAFASSQDASRIHGMARMARQRARTQLATGPPQAPLTTPLSPHVMIQYWMTAPELPKLDQTRLRNHNKGQGPRSLAYIKL